MKCMLKRWFSRILIYKYLDNSQISNSTNNVDMFVSSMYSYARFNAVTFNLTLGCLCMELHAISCIYHSQIFCFL